MRLRADRDRRAGVHAARRARAPPRSGRTLVAGRSALSARHPKTAGGSRARWRWGSVERRARPDLVRRRRLRPGLRGRLRSERLPHRRGDHRRARSPVPLGARRRAPGAWWRARRPRTGLVLGNLSFPTSSMSRYAESVWLDAQGPRYAGGHAAARAGVTRPHAFNRFTSGLPAHLAARALGLGRGRLRARRRLRLVALRDQARLRPAPRSQRRRDGRRRGQPRRRPVHPRRVLRARGDEPHRAQPALPPRRRRARPRRGRGFVVLRRLADAVASGSRVLGVIRGIGLSNDGRGRGLLAPSEEGQERAMRMALHGARLAPADIVAGRVPRDRDAGRRRDGDPQHGARVRRAAPTCPSAR